MNLRNLFGEYDLGRVQSYKNMAIVPVKKRTQSDLEYIVLDEGLKSGTVQVIETGSVNTLTIKKKTDEDLLIVKGEYIIGGKQNRQLTANGLIRKNEIDVPAHCVQQHRWSSSFDRNFRESPEFTAASIRSSITKDGAYGATQGETWDSIKYLASSLGSHSGTDDYFEITRAREGDIEEYIDNFSMVRGQTGMIAVVGDMYFVDVFDNSSTLNKHFERLLKSYAVDALANHGKETRVDDNFLEQVLDIETKRSESLDLGKDYEFRENIKGRRVQGSALVYKDNVVYLGASQGSNDVPKRRRPINPWPIIPMPEPFPEEPDQPICPSRPYSPRGPFWRGNSTDDSHRYHRNDSTDNRNIDEQMREMKYGSLGK